MPISGRRLPRRITQPREIYQLLGRVPGHVENDATGRVYMVLEGMARSTSFRTTM